MDSDCCEIGPACGSAWGWRKGGRCPRCRVAHNEEVNRYRGLKAEQREKALALVPIWLTTLPVTDEPVPFTDLPAEDWPSGVSVLAAAWLLMQQPILTERVRKQADGPTRRAHARAGLGDPTVTIVDLRRQYVPQDQDSSEGTDIGGRRYKNRWVVSGHWRNQPYGPDRALRRQTWIPAYVKGPEGAPLLATERVNVWRR